MAIARVSSFDFSTEESMRNALRRYREEREFIFPNLELSMCVNTGPSSFVDIAVYPDHKQQIVIRKRDKSFMKMCLELRLKMNSIMKATLITFISLKRSKT